MTVVEDKLFEVPRVAVVVDETDPTVLKLAFSGSVELERGNHEAVEFYNSFVAGQDASVHVVVNVAGARKRHRRDSEGDVDAVVEVKSLVVTDLSYA